MDNLKSEYLVKINDILRAKAEKAIFSPQDILKPLREIGFHSCLFYDATYNIATDDFQLILSATDGPESQKEYIGWKVDYKDTKLASFHLGYSEPIVQKECDVAQSDKLKELCINLGIYDKPRIHTPIHYRGTLIGALSCVWDSGIDDLSSEHAEGLKIIGSMITRYWSMTNRCLIQQITKDIEDNLKAKGNGNDLSAVLENVAELTLKAIGGKIAAIFHYDWYGDKLNKQFEARSWKCTKPILEESYFVNNCLTGTAWCDEKFRHVSDFNGLKTHYDFHINKESLQYHNNLIGEVNSVLYYPFGNKSRFFFRIMNRNDNAKLPFLSSHRIILTDICERLDGIIDDIVSEQKLVNLQGAARSAITNITNPIKTINKVVNALNIECVNELVVLASNPKYQHFSYKYSNDSNLNKQLEKVVVWEDDSFFRACMNKNNISVLAVSDFEEVKQKGHFINNLKDKNINFVIIAPFTSVQLKGFLLLFPPPGTLSTAKSLLGRLSNEHKESLKAHASIIGNCIETADSHLTAERATRLIGHIGHEVKGPISTLGNAGIASLWDAVEKFERIKDGQDVNIDESIIYFESEIENIGEIMDQINISMEVAVDMAQESKNTIQCYFGKYDLYDVLVKASKEALMDPYTNYVGKPYKVIYDFNKRAKNMPKLVGDTTLLHKAFVNIFRNAQKYSLPDGEGNPIKIVVLGIAQENQNIIQVTNRGLQIPHEFHDRIFNAFERGDTFDKRKARRGMGLGLYLARKFFACHNGSIFLQNHWRYKNDPHVENIGWETTFEVRLPFGINEGAYDVSL